MQLPQYIIDLVGSLFDKGADDETICFAAIQAWKEGSVSFAQTADVRTSM